MFLSISSDQCREFAHRPGQPLDLGMKSPVCLNLILTQLAELYIQAKALSPVYVNSLLGIY